MLQLAAATALDLEDLTEFLQAADLTLSGLGASAVRLWIARDPGTGRIVASTGFEGGEDTRQVLIRSVAVYA